MLNPISEARYRKEGDDYRMCDLYRMDDRDWVNKWAQDVESLINLMPAYQINPDQWAPVIRNTSAGRNGAGSASAGVALALIREDASSAWDRLRKLGLGRIAPKVVSRVWRQIHVSVTSAT
ncbi:hypothetical protein RGR602_PC02202 (plasmid) [Rhizobium gallicum bv. gallicum R602sp]|uniref:Uncharacterized protein n=1 Tax=Rhizobium gallicum bv. gallicum R602sp TaxID=1041138 RepID=A0A0B4XIG8_9HYPH|nr:hypothetical protein RGR602_PC02202 [Rhizobium gallicum bv. gallicum R602sp]